MDWHLTAYHWSGQVISKDVLKFFSALFQMKEAKRLKEFLEDYDDERDDPKFYRFFFFFFFYTL